MINLDLYKTFPFNWIVFSDNGERVAQNKGALFKNDFDEDEDYLVDFYYKSDNLGWGTCDRGYAYHSCLLKDGLIFVAYGLKVKPYCKIKGKSENLSIWMETSEYSSVLTNFLQTVNKTMQNFHDLIKSNLHEINSLMSLLANSSYTLHQDLETYGEDFLLTRSKQIQSCHEMISKRLQYFTFLFEDNTNTQIDKDLDVYRKVIKSVQTLRPLAHKKDVKINMEGKTDAIVKGANLFEIAPFVLIENAVKYAPPKSHIQVQVEEVDGGFVEFNIESFGPKIEPHEFDDIFKQNYRGMNAKKTQGSGVGLFVAKKIIKEIHDGELKVNQSWGNSKFSPQGMYRTNFIFRLPIQ